MTARDIDVDQRSTAVRVKIAEAIRTPTHRGPGRAPARDDARRLHEPARGAEGCDAIAAQLDQWPLQIGGTMFKVEWLPIIEPHEAPAGVDKRGWDFAGSKARKADQTANACVRRGVDKRFYLMGSAAMRGGPGEVDNFVKARHAVDPPTLDWSIPRDPGATGQLGSRWTSQ